MCIANGDIHILAHSARTCRGTPGQEQPESGRRIRRVRALIEYAHRYPEPRATHMERPHVFIVCCQFQVRQRLGLTQDGQVYLQSFHQHSKLRWSRVQTLQRIRSDFATSKDLFGDVHPVGLPERVLLHPSLTFAIAARGPHPIQRVTCYIKTQRFVTWAGAESGSAQSQAAFLCRAGTFSLSFQWPHQ